MKGLGLHNDVIDLLDKELAIKRIHKDVGSDFIFAPHFNIIYQKLGDDLFDILIGQLKSGQYNPNLPITVNVIKPNGFNRPGSILEPLDRLAYQLIVDFVAPQAEHELDRSQVFSNQLLEEDSEGFMFSRPSESYQGFQSRIEELCNNESYNYVLRADIASYFDRIYQHVIGNLLYSSGANAQAVSFLEKFLLKLSQNDSHGIIQGHFPSDFLGNFALCSIDANHSLDGLEFSRYVDDMYIFFPELNEARSHKVKLSNWLRCDGLSLNEAKTKILKTEDLLKEETEIDRLFSEARDEIYAEIEEEQEEQRNEAKEEALWSSLGYGTINFWDINEPDIEIEGDIDEEEVELRAIETLFDQEVDRSIRLKIIKFCLPVFGIYSSDYPLDYVISNFANEPSLAQTYFSYLVSMLKHDNSIASRIEEIIPNVNMIFDYQKLWLYSTLLFANEISQDTVRYAVSELRNMSADQSLRAICAILIGKNGTAAQRRVLKNHYATEQSSYVRAAILYSAQYFPSQERDTCYKAWSGHNETNSLIVKALKK